MTSSIPMFSPHLILNNCLYVENCITDPQGIIQKIEKEDFYGSWQNTNPNSTDCFDVKLNHAKNNLYYKKINLNNKNNKTLYLYNSFKMAFDFTSNIYSKTFKVNVKNNSDFDIYKQICSPMFDKTEIDSSGLTMILFLNDTLQTTPTIIKQFDHFKEIIPTKGSMLILPSNSQYNIGYFLNEDRYYSLITSELI